jgi:hypothetical protein
MHQTGANQSDRHGDRFLKELWIAICHIEMYAADGVAVVGFFGELFG